jgi:hypothetical protein
MTKRSDCVRANNKNYYERPASLGLPLTWIAGFRQPGWLLQSELASPHSTDGRSPVHGGLAAEDDAVKRDEIAGRQLAAIRQYQRPRQKKFSLADVKRLFEMMKDQA